MPESLSTLLHSHPYKKIDSLRQVCGALSLSGNGIAETMRNCILDHVGENGERDNDVRELAIKYKQEQHKKQQQYPSSPIIHILNGSTPPKDRRSRKDSMALFDQSETNDKSIAEAIDEMEEIHA